MHTHPFTSFVMSPPKYLLPLLTLSLLAACSTSPTPHHTVDSAPGSLKVDVPRASTVAEQTPEWWYRSGAAHAANNGAMGGRAKNVILFLGDGMSLTTVAAARILDDQRKGRTGEENLLSWETFPHTGFSKTYNTDAQTPDSAGTMTAITTGVKSHMGAIGVSAGQKDDCADSLSKHALTWLQLGDSAGLATGVVSTARLTHATPAATFAHVPNRNWENDTELPPEAVAQGCRDIAQQLVEASRFGQGPRVVLGGGRGQFMPVSQHDPEYDDKVGKRLDDRDLIAEWQRKNPQGTYVWNLDQLHNAGQSPAVLGLFEYDHMQFEHDRANDRAGEPSLAEMTRTAIDILSRNRDGYILMVEGARIDHAHHYGNAHRALTDTIALSEAVQAAMDATSANDTLIIVTADHSHTLNFVGYPQRGNPILGKVHGLGSEDDAQGVLVRDLTGLPYTTLSYANGPGNTGESNRQPAGPKQFLHVPSRVDPVEGRPDLSHVDTEHPDYLQESLVPLKSESHGGEDVGVWAHGPGSQAIRGTFEQNAIYHFIVQSTPKLRQRLCAAGTCDTRGIPVELPRPTDFEKPEP